MTFRIPNSAFRILWAFWRLNLAEELQYRANFIASLLGTVFDMATALLTLALFFHHTTTLGGWDYWEIVVLLGVFNALTGVIEAVLRPGIGQLAGEVRSGELDLVLVKPVDAQGFVSFRSPGPPRFRRRRSPAGCGRRSRSPPPSSPRWRSRWHERCGARRSSGTPARAGEG